MISYASTKLIESERTHNSNELECLGVVWARKVPHILGRLPLHREPGTETTSTTREEPRMLPKSSPSNKFADVIPQLQHVTAVGIHR